jgi:hypothetical protein
MRKLYVYTSRDEAITEFETLTKPGDDLSALAIMNHDEFVVIASPHQNVIAAFEKKYKTEEVSDLDLMSMQMNKEMVEIRGREYTLMPFT